MGGREERGAEGRGVHASVAYVSAMQPGVPPSHVYVNALKDLFIYFFGLIGKSRSRHRKCFSLRIYPLLENRTILLRVWMLTELEVQLCFCMISQSHAFRICTFKSRQNRRLNSRLRHRHSAVVSVLHLFIRLFLIILCSGAVGCSAYGWSCC